MPPAADGSAATEAFDDSGISADSPYERAKHSFHRGELAFEQQRYQDAVDAFLEADRLSSSAAFSYNIAQAYEALKEPAQALYWYKDYLKRNPTAGDRSEVQGYMAELEQVLSRSGVQLLVVRTSPPGATVRVDGVVRGVTPWRAPLKPGAHRVQVELEGHQSEKWQVSLPLERSIDVDLQLKQTLIVMAPAPVPPPPQLDLSLVEVSANPGFMALDTPQAEVLVSRPPAEPAETPMRLRTWSWAALGTGVCGIAAAGGFELARRSAEEDAEVATVQLDKEKALEQMESRELGGRVAAALGSGLLVAGGLLWALSDEEKTEERAITRVGVGVSRSEVTAAVGGRF